MSLTGEADGEPMRMGVAFADVFTGVYSAVGILAALAEREKTGRGSHVDMALMDSMVSVLANQSAFYLVSGKLPPRLGNAHATVVPYQVFPSSDGHLIIAVGNDGQFVKFCALLGVPDLAKDARYVTNGARVVNRATLLPQLTALTAKRTRADLLAGLEKAGVPAGPINDLADVFADPQVVARKLKIDPPSTHAKGGSVPGVRSPIVMNGDAQVAATASPGLGEHTDEILREIGEA
jgi:crotonobetainyl-CoA:carnitine CoA-transferase CaiB-like acyl-CoA transferase